MESTLLASFLKASKIKRWLANPQNPSIVKEIKSLFDKIYSSGDLDKNSKTIELMDDDEVNAKYLPASSAPKIVQQFLNPGKTSVRLHARFKRHGIIYAVSKTHEGNSQILYYPNGNTSSKPVVGIITFIYSEKTKSVIQPAAIVQRLKPLNSESPDPFSKYPHWPAQLYYCNLSTYERIQPDWVHGHFARWNINTAHMVAVPLNRVSFFSLYLFTLSSQISRINVPPAVNLVPPAVNLIYRQLHNYTRDVHTVYNIHDCGYHTLWAMSGYILRDQCTIVGR